MTSGYPAMPSGVSFVTSRVYFPAGEYAHPPTGLVQLRLVRRGSSYADIDLGAGSRRVFTRPGDLLLSLPDRPTAFRLDDGRELTLLQVAADYAAEIVGQCGPHSLEDLSPLLARPARDSLIAELLRRLETTDPTASNHWAVGVVFANLLALAAARSAQLQSVQLSEELLAALLARVEAGLGEAWPVQRLADEIGLPRRTFAAAFRAATGVSVHQYVLRMRTERAAELLQGTDLPIASVAVEAGFANQAHMTRVLNRLRRTTPGRLRSGHDPNRTPRR